MFQRIDRIVTLVPDLAAAQDFFTKVFGLAFDEVITDEGLQIKLVHAGRFGLELCQPLSADSPLAAQMQDWLAEHGPGVRAVVVKVEQMDDALSQLRKHGIEPIAQMTVGKAREALLDPAATFNIPIIINQFPDTHPMTIAGQS